MGKSQKYLHNVTITISGQIGGIDPDLIGVHFTDEEFPVMFWAVYGEKIIEALGKFGPEALGRITASGYGHLGDDDICHWDMNEGGELTSAGDPGHLLKLLAAYVVAAKLCLVVRNDLYTSEEEEMKLNDDLSRAEAIRHQGFDSSNIPDARRYER